MSAKNGNSPTCSEPGCDVRAHGRGLCRRHYDRERYERTTVDHTATRPYPPVFTREELRYELPVLRPRPGHRTAAWWQQAGRPEHLTECPHFDLDTPQDERADEYDDFRIEPVQWLAANGHLRPDEIAELAEEAEEARARINTPAERIGSGGVDRADQRRVKLYEAVERALEDD